MLHYQEIFLKLQEEDENFTKNVVYKDILLSKNLGIVHFIYVTHKDKYM